MGRRKLVRVDRLCFVLVFVRCWVGFGLPGDRKSRRLFTLSRVLALVLMTVLRVRESESFVRELNG